MADLSALRKLSGAVLAASLIPSGVQAEDGGNRTVVTPNRREGPAFESASQTHVVTQDRRSSTRSRCRRSRWSSGRARCCMERTRWAGRSTT